MPLNLSKNLPAPIPRSYSSTSLSATIVELGLALIAPELGFPIILAEIAAAVLVPEKLNEYLGVLDKSISIINNLLSIIKSANELGLTGTKSDALNRIADALYIKDDEDNDIPIAKLLSDISQSELPNLEGQYEPATLGKVLGRFSNALYWRDSNNHFIPLGESLGRVVLTNLLRAFPSA